MRLCGEVLSLCVDQAQEPDLLASLSRDEA